MESVGIAGRSLRLWDLLPVTARNAEFFLVQAAPSNEDLISLNGSILEAGQRSLLHRDALMKTSICGPDPKASFQIWAVTK